MPSPEFRVHIQYVTSLHLVCPRCQKSDGIVVELSSCDLIFQTVLEMCNILQWKKWEFFEVVPLKRRHL